ncbi:GGDEF domain-containing protein [Acidocella sp.]|uniref:GGDEF domain-containing protein n=1 Tax=Acidocella sp. TaxID=50710 RepID=UPI002604248F|nr:GGDEF domain-containing protein [Acidocella sp.]MDD2794651.1 GGDEF domain-containing protein [Acidocella sp.]
MYSHLPVGRLVGCLERLTREQTWLAVLAATAAITAAERLVPGIEFSPLYVPVICIASWRLGARPGYITAAGAAVLMTILTSGSFDDRAIPIMLGKFIISIVSFVYVARLITSFRQAYNRERYLARRDRMTGALNHECFREQARATLAMARNKGEFLLLAMLDFDDFKDVNSNHGHSAGDSVLRGFSRAAVSIIRRHDDFGRLGGDEFAVLMVLHSSEEAKPLATVLHARLSEVLSNGPIPVTCSMGALVIPPDNTDSEADLLHQADMLMYAAKRSGKNSLHIEWCGTLAPELIAPEARRRWKPA